MEKYHRQIASVSLQHEYYADGNLPDATIHPFPETQLFLKNHRMIFKRKSHFYVLLQETEVLTNNPTIPIGHEPQYLCFGVSFNDPHYQLRSGLNYDPRQNKIVIETGEEEVSAVSENSVMPCWNYFRGNPDEVNMISNRNDEVVFSTETDDKNAFANLDTGIYKTNDIYFFKYNGSLEWDAVIICKLSESESSIDKKISIPAGSYHWRYKVQKKFNKHTALRVVDEEERMSFTEMKAPQEDQAVFYSREPIKLSQQALMTLSLYNNETIVKKFLPVPEIINARFFSSEEKSLVLEAYVTI